MSTSTLAIRTLDLDDLTVLGLDGRMDASDVAQFDEAMDRALERPVSTVVLDLSLLDHLAIEGSDSLARAARHAHEQHGRVIVRQPSPATKAVLDLTGTSAVLEFGD
jgi:anti-anti-sigma factor